MTSRDDLPNLVRDARDLPEYVYLDNARAGYLLKDNGRNETVATDPSLACPPKRESQISN